MRFFQFQWLVSVTVWSTCRSMSFLDPTAVHRTCEDAVVVRLDDLPVISLEGEDADMGFGKISDDLPDCDADGRGEGVWYELIPDPTTPRFVKASVLAASETPARFGLSLLKGRSCGARECLQAEDYQLQNQLSKEPSLTWFAADPAEGSYYLRVSRRGGPGPFTLTVEVRESGTRCVRMKKCWN